MHWLNSDYHGGSSYLHRLLFLSVLCGSLPAPPLPSFLSPAPSLCLSLCCDSVWQRPPLGETVQIPTDSRESEDSRTGRRQPTCHPSLLPPSLPPSLPPPSHSLHPTTSFLSLFFCDFLFLMILSKWQPDGRLESSGAEPPPPHPPCDMSVQNQCVGTRPDPTTHY